MRFSKRDLTKFSLYTPTETADSDGDIVNVYGSSPDLEFEGHIQPFDEKNATEAYGASIKYTHVVYTQPLASFKEFDRIFDGISRYEIKSVQRRRSACRLKVERLSD